MVLGRKVARRADSETGRIHLCGEEGSSQVQRDPGGGCREGEVKARYRTCVKGKTSRLETG